MFPGLDLHYTDPAQHLRTAGDELDDLDHDLSDLFEVWKHLGSKRATSIAAQLRV